MRVLLKKNSKKKIWRRKLNTCFSHTLIISIYHLGEGSYVMPQLLKRQTEFVIFFHSWHTKDLRSSETSENNSIKVTFPRFCSGHVCRETVKPNVTNSNMFICGCLSYHKMPLNLWQQAFMEEKYSENESLNNCPVWRRQTHSFLFSFQRGGQQLLDGVEPSEEKPEPAAGPPGDVWKHLGRPEDSFIYVGSARTLPGRKHRRLGSPHAGL